MKNLTLILSLAVFLFSKARSMPVDFFYDNFGTNSVRSSEEFDPYKMKPPLIPTKPKKRIPFFMITIHSHPIIEITKFPTENIISINKQPFSYVNMNEGDSLNGIKMCNHLTLTPTLDNKLFFNNIIEAFGNYPFQYAMGYMPRNIFKALYPISSQRK